MSAARTAVRLLADNERWWLPLSAGTRTARRTTNMLTAVAGKRDLGVGAVVEIVPPNQSMAIQQAQYTGASRT